MKTEWIVTETSPYSGEKPVVKAYRSVEEAREAVEHEICELLVDEDAPVAEGDQVGRTSEASEPRSGRKSPRPRFDPRDVYWPDENNARIGDEVIWKIEPHETLTRKETTMNELKREVRDIIDNYDPDARPRDCEGCSLPHGSRTPTSGGYDFEDTILKLASVGAAPCGPCGVRFAQAT